MSNQAGLYIVGDVPQPSYYTRIPNMAIEQLGAFAFKLLAIFMDVARTTEKCWMSNKDIAKKLGCTVNSMKKARTELVDKGYVLVEDGTELSRAKVTILFRDIWRLNHDKYADAGSKPEGGVSKFDTPLSWDDTPLSKFDTLTKQDIITREVNKEKESPLPPAGGKSVPKETAIPDSELSDMEQAVKTELKQYNKRQRLNVARILLQRLTGKDMDQNIDGPKMTPERLTQFGAWWDRTKVKDGKPLTRPKNIGSVKQFVDEWQELGTLQSKPVIDLHTQMGAKREDFGLDLYDSPFDLKYPDGRRASA